MGSVTSLPIPSDGVSSIVPRMVAGLKRLGCEPDVSTKYQPTPAPDQPPAVDTETAEPTVIDPGSDKSAFRNALRYLIEIVSREKRKVFYSLLTLILLSIIILMFGRFGSGLQRSNPFSRHATLSDSEIKGLEIQSTLVGHTYSVDSLTFGADDGLLISTGYDGVLFWDTSSGKIRSRLADTENGNGGLAISADKKVLATSKGKTVQVWELPSGTLKQTLNGLTWRAISVIVTPKGDLVIAAAMIKRSASGGRRQSD